MNRRSLLKSYGVSYSLLQVNLIKRPFPSDSRDFPKRLIKIAFPTPGAFKKI
ncbi:MAG: hypothetical protein ACTSRI_17770 [Promethearchaeota archaeon]